MAVLPPNWLTNQSYRFADMAVKLWDVGAQRGLSRADMLVFSALNRASAMAQGFNVLVQANNFMCASPLVRLQLDNGLRTFALMIGSDADETAHKIMGGEELRNLPDSKGKCMNDGYLANRVDEALPGLAVYKFYKQWCSYIHFSEKAFIQTWSMPEGERPGAEIKMSVGDPGSFVGQKEWDTLAADFERASDITAGILKAWLILRSKSRPGAPA